MAADLSALTQALLTAVLLIGSLSAGLPVPEDAPIEITPPVDVTPAQQSNDEAITQMLQQPQKVDITPTSETPSDTALMDAPPLVETPSVETPFVETPLSETQLTPAVVQHQPEQHNSDQPAAAELSRPDCPEMGEKHIVLCEADDKKGDIFHMNPLPKDTPSAPEADIAQ